MFFYILALYKEGSFDVIFTTEISDAIIYKIASNQVYLIGQGYNYNNSVFLQNDTV